MNEPINLNLTRREFDSLSSDMIKDLTAVFNLMEEDINNLLQQAVDEGWTADKLIAEVENLI